MGAMWDGFMGEMSRSESMLPISLWADATGNSHPSLPDGTGK